MSNKPIFKVYKDWEQRLAGLINEAVENPHRQAHVCEDIIELIEYLLTMDRLRYHRKILQVIDDVFQERHQPKAEPYR